jgi:hypothetical protein
MADLFFSVKHPLDAVANKMMEIGDGFSKDPLEITIP